METRTGEIDERVAVLQARRRAGLLTDDKLHLSAYLGDPAARILWAPNTPSEEAVQAALHEEFFAGLAEEIEAGWRAWLSETLMSEPPIGDEPLLWGRRQELVARAMDEPRLRALVPQPSGFSSVYLGRCTRPLLVHGKGFSARVESYGAQLSGVGYESVTEMFSSAEAAIAWALEALPPAPLTVWRGGPASYPLARVRLGATNDGLDAESQIIGLLAWGERAFLYGLAALALSEAIRREDAHHRRALSAIARWIIDPSEAEALRAAMQGIECDPWRGLGLDNWVYQRFAGAYWTEGFSDIDQDRMLGHVLTGLDRDEALSRIRGALLPWTLGDGCPLSGLLDARS